MHTPPSVRKIVRQRVAAVTVTVFAAGLLLGVTGSAGAAPAPTVSQVQARLKSLQTKSDKLDQQYGQVKQELTSTNQRLGLIHKEISADSARFAGLQKEIDLIGVADYEGGNFNTSLAMLASGNASNAQGMLNRSSILQELSASNNAKISQFLVAARQLNAKQRVTIYREEWLPELLFLSRKAESRPITRFVTGMRYSLGLLMSARRVARDLRRADRVELVPIKTTAASDDTADFDWLIDGKTGIPRGAAWGDVLRDSDADGELTRAPGTHRYARRAVILRRTHRMNHRR